MQTSRISNAATGFLYDNRFLKHKTGEEFPERPERLSYTRAHLERLPFYGSLRQLQAEEVGLDWISKVHTPEHIRNVEQACKAIDNVDTVVSFGGDDDVPICRDSFEIAKLAVGSALVLGDEVAQGNINNGFALLRPPGHHAEPDKAMGFCLFSNIAILAKYLQEKYGIEKVLILDWDVHHGNGTQKVFYEDPSVLFISLHQDRLFPDDTGLATETGRGKGKGMTLNCPMPAGAQDKDYKQAFEGKILPKIKEFKPDIVLISAGFDAHKEDPLANICLTTECYSWMTEQMMEVAERFSGNKLISLLEGGYNLKILPECVEAHLKTLCSRV